MALDLQWSGTDRMMVLELIIKRSDGNDIVIAFQAFPSSDFGIGIVSPEASTEPRWRLESRIDGLYINVSRRLQNASTTAHNLRREKLRGCLHFDENFIWQSDTFIFAIPSLPRGQPNSEPQV